MKLQIRERSLVRLARRFNRADFLRILDLLDFPRQEDLFRFQRGQFERFPKMVHHGFHRFDACSQNLVDCV